MLAYGLAKTAVHSLAMNLAEQAKANKFSGRVVTILPEVIDTLENRKSMPSEDFTKWAKPEQIS